MLSKLFVSARNLFNSAPQINLDENSSSEVADTEMVTTRAGKNASPDSTSAEDSIVVDVPRSSRKRSRKATEEEDSRAVDAEVISMRAKKQKALPLREKDEATTNISTRLVVEIPVSSLPVDVRGVIEVSDDSNEVEDEDQQEDEEEGEGISRDASQFETADSESEGPSDAEDSLEPTFSSTKKKSKTPSPKKSVSTPLSIKPKHKRFGSDEPELEPDFFSTAAEILDSDDESSDDGAPEVVGAQDALKSAKSKARDAAKAVEGQVAALRKKRQDRDAVLKTQAEAASKKHKREEEKASKEFTEAKVTLAPPISRSNLPDLLPEEYLQDDSENEELEESENEIVRAKPKKMKFADLVEKRPKDRRKGSTTYRVSEVHSKNLAPKSSFHAKSTKESWLMGRAGKGPGGIRKVAPGGFFRKK